MIFLQTMRKKLDLGLLILIASMLIGIFSKMSIFQILENFLFASIDSATVNVVGIIILIGILGNILREGGILQKINFSMESFIKNKRLTLIAPSVLMGLLPVPAGAMLSAPMVEEAGNRMQLNAEIKTFLNYWFRHPWEFSWPIYPGLILASSILNISIHKLIFTQLPLMVVALAVGYIFGLRKVPHAKALVEKKNKLTKNARKKDAYMFFFHLWPIFAIIMLVLVLNIELILSLFIILIFAFLTTKISKKRIPFIIKNSLSWRIILLIISVMVFKRILITSGVLPIVAELFKRIGISPLVTLFSIPFVAGILTGLSMASIPITLPLFLPIIGIDNPNLYYAMLVYTGGVCGYLLSPLHLCLVTTTAYFKADFSRVYKLIILPVFFVAAASFVIVFLHGFFG
ncbi:DUF401 family protein [Candidatus Aerophobetes bacterium]|nr:DUF401 family protein [Candidatus Aerophobetes bacterium]